MEGGRTEINARIAALDARQSLVEQRQNQTEIAHRDGQREILRSLEGLARIEQVPAQMQTQLRQHANAINGRLGAMETTISKRLDEMEDRLEAHDGRIKAIESDAQIRVGRGQMLNVFAQFFQWFAANWFQIIVGLGVLAIVARETVPAPIREHIEQTPLAAAALPEAVTASDWALDPLRGR